MSLVREQIRSSRVKLDALERLARSLKLQVVRPTNPRVVEFYRRRLVHTIDRVLARQEAGTHGTESVHADPAAELARTTSMSREYADSLLEACGGNVETAEACYRLFVIGGPSPLVTAGELRRRQ
jgi:hypothetical protein